MPGTVGPAGVRRRVFFLLFRQDRVVELAGTLERIVFQNRENSWTVGRLRAESDNRLCNIIGKLPGVVVGETLRLTGHWVQNPKFGEQFEIESFTVRQPATEGGIEKYLASGLVKGVGPEMAKRIVERFGTDTLDIIDSQPNRLIEVEGIGEKRLAMIREDWSGHQNARETLVFLHDLPIGSALAARIYETYKGDTVLKVRSDPYLLAEEVWGVGFLTADRVASALGIGKDSPRRAQAGVLYSLSRLFGSGHVCYPREELIRSTTEFLEIDEEMVEAAVTALLAEGSICTEEFEPDREVLYRVEMCEAEEGVARRVREILSDKTPRREIDSFQALQWLESSLEMNLGREQMTAVETAIDGRLAVVTGGPGTGKTTLVRSLLVILERVGEEVLLGAPTGRAAKKLEEATGKPASTLHRLLEFDPRTGLFGRNETNLLTADTVIVDEVSMVDLMLMFNLVLAIPPGCRLVLVGDVDQLPSVGPGNVLRDLIGSGTIRTVRLTEIYRQAQESRIVVNSHRVNRGEMLLLDDNARDFRFVEVDSSDEALTWLKEFLSGEILHTYRFDPVRDVQILSPMHKGLMGVTNLNRELQTLFNPKGDEIRREDKILREGDKVIQLRNNYELDVFNGDVGTVHSIDPGEAKLEVFFGRRRVVYGFNNLDELTLAYAISVHKSQGSEYRAVVVALLGEHYPMLQRNLLYTALTRGRELVVLIGSKKTVGQAVRNNRIRERYSYLAHRLRSGGPAGKWE